MGRNKESSAKLDKGDQQLEMVGNYVVTFFKSLAVGIKKMIKKPNKMLIFVIVTLISGVIFYLRDYIAELIVPETEFHILKIALLATPIIPILILCSFGSETDEGNKDDFESKFAMIKFCGKDGSYPKFKGEEKEGKKVIYTFYSPGITVLEWRSREKELENVLNCNIEKIVNPKDTKQIIKLHTVPADQGLEDNLLWNDNMIREKDFILCIGVGLLEPVEINLNKYPHALIAGVTGSGKSVILRAMLWQCIKKGARIYMIDFKGGVEFGIEYEQFGEVVMERQHALELMKELTKEMKIRLAEFRKCGVKNIEEYNKIHTEKPLCRIILVCDEVSEMLDKTGLQKKDQAIFYEIEGEMSSLARLSRAAGINMILATQRPDAKVIPGQIKNNLPIRISGRMVDKHASEIILGNTKASQLGETLGRFMYTVGADTYEFQAFNFSDDSLVKGDYQIGSMLIEQGYGDNLKTTNQEYDDLDEELDYEPNLSEEEINEMVGF
ncbi:MAG: FtsK/SpoIIIE domain-containing protein [Aminipila sp.]